MEPTRRGVKENGARQLSTDGIALLSRYLIGIDLGTTNSALAPIE
jgi:hypothetical protein